MDFSKDYYAILGVHPSAEKVVIDAAYKALAKRYHPWSSPQKVVHLLVWEINPIRNMKGGLKWLRKDTNPKKS